MKGQMRSRLINKLIENLIKSLPVINEYHN